MESFSSDYQETYMQKISNPLCNIVSGIIVNNPPLICEYKINEKLLLIGKDNLLNASEGQIKINIG